MTCDNVIVTDAAGEDDVLIDDGLPVMSDDVTSTDVGDEDNVKMGDVLAVDSKIPSSNKMESSTCTRAIK